MNKKKFFKSIIFFFFLFFSFSYISFSNSLDEVYIDVKLEENGDATMHTQWLFHANEHTENYIVITNLGDSNIVNFEVSEDGVPFTYQKNWNINKSREEKKSKFGYIKKGNTYELCWGIGDYRTHTFNIEYGITKMVKNLKDAQMLNFQFINSEMSTPPEKVTLIIRADRPFTEEDVKMWAFGFEGTIYLDDGKIVVRSDRYLSRRNYVTVLLRFNKNYFNTDSFINKNFEQVKKKSLKNSDYSNPTSFFPIIIFTIIISIFVIIFGTIISVIISSFFIYIKRRRRISSLNGQYFRDIPYDGHLEEIVFPLLDLKMTTNRNILTAFFLKWIKDQTITTVSKKKSSFFGKDRTEFILNNPKVEMGPLEREYFNFTVSASGENKVLEGNEFKKWANINYNKINTFVNKLKSNSEKIMIKKGYIKKVKKRRLIFFKFTKNELTDKGIELTDNLIKFRNYLNNFSLLNERTSPNVHLWDEYMVYAALLGITGKVQKEFNKLYPDYDKVSNLSTPSVRSAYMTSYIFYTSYRSSYNSAHRSSGSGGSSSFGGGGGSFGGGSGGGSR